MNGISIKRAERILANYDRNIKNSYKKTIEEQQTKLFRKKTTIALFVIGTPLFILAWPLISAVVYGFAELEVNQALAHQKISLVHTLSEALEKAENQSPEKVFQDLVTSDGKFSNLYKKIFKKEDEKSFIEVAQFFKERPRDLVNSIPLWQTLVKIKNHRISPSSSPPIPTARQPLSESSLNPNGVVEETLELSIQTDHSLSQTPSLEIDLK